MIWKLYRALLKTALQYVFSACFGNSYSTEIDEPLDTIHRLMQIIACLKQAYSYHPSFLMNTYGGVDGYLQAHLSQSDWLLLVSIVEPVPAAYPSEHLL